MTEASNQTTAGPLEAASSAAAGKHRGPAATSPADEAAPPTPHGKHRKPSDLGESGEATAA
ncbi:hypothetical protein [Streptomyces tsukubensis]|uniref:Uncharacterized protein n=1 Tax=Streptomyces tsukubensis TaxID=83656 RepID=A0A1V4A626_9ACTN|nr:hypothetical protein [Streptomyces tsukubensis]OON76715.1 hypothetical protein B1H18_20625 [Streptomyces tsukubensis]QFR93317.1 hypothetical protein GBW32_09725 [Streptomyces tsukubensis]